MNIWLARLFLALIVSLGFMQPALSFSGYRLPVTELIFVATATVFSVAILRRHKTLIHDAIYKYLGLFILAMIASAGFSLDPDRSFVKLSGVLYLTGLTVLAIHIVSTERMLRSAILLWIVASTIVSLIGLITVVIFYIDRSSPWHSFFLHHYGSLPVGNYPRIQSTFLYPAMLCNYLTIGFLLTLAAGKAKWIGKKATIGVTAVHCLSIAFTFTPGIGGFLFAGLAWACSVHFSEARKALRRTLMTTGVVAAVASVVVSAISIWPIPTSPYFLTVFGTRLDPTQRMLTWQGAWETFLNFPIFGKGIGLGVAAVEFLAPSGQMQILTDAHNTWLSVAAQAGAFGLASLMMLTIGVIYRGVQPGPSDALPPVRSALLIAFISSFIIQGFVGSFEDARHLWILIGLVIASSKLVGTPNETN